MVLLTHILNTSGLYSVLDLYFKFMKVFTESLRLEKTSKIIKSNHQPITTLPSKPCPEVP